MTSLQSIVRGLLVCVAALTLLAPSSRTAAAALKRDFGDRSSATLVGKAWKALEAEDYDSVLAYTNKCIELYGKTAQKMQGILLEYPTGTNEQVHTFWALNDVATAYFIQAEAYRAQGDYQKARKAYQAIIDRYSFGQCWDPRGWFWKPADAARETLREIDRRLE